MRILVTGGLGYIGSHFIVRALELGHEVTAIDNLSNSSISVKKTIEEITNKTFDFFEADLKDPIALAKIFHEHKYDCVVHFAGLKSVADSKTNPIAYYANNVTGSLNLFEAMKAANVHDIIFSSSATVYGTSDCTAYTEEHPKNPVNTYGHTKLITEQMLQNICSSDAKWSVMALRYFNPLGAHASGKLGENPKGIPNNLMPYITRVASGEYEALQIFGTDYKTTDGTGVRDYIHVMDLVEGHLAALEYQKNNRGYEAFNLGTGKGFSVLDVVKAFEQENGIRIPLIKQPRRDGDLAEYWANPSKAKNKLSWEATRNLSDMVRDAWHWQKTMMTEILPTPVQVEPIPPLTSISKNKTILFFSDYEPTHQQYPNDEDTHKEHSL
ncbi:UDP-glucose 4-epimerase GalE [uncultured Legionella sp.]|uniref:UDP-glucose 4-epimerase GalE n=1 Tax=uncultured Legionella sp. TaxID=210934 RepID=UPI002607C732|nr:UDP-glucose 4-epimerase GalE [uncultured Legionella sp.]